MENRRELCIDSGIHTYVDVVFGRTYFQTLPTNLKLYIQTISFQVDYNEKKI